MSFGILFVIRKSVEKISDSVLVGKSQQNNLDVIVKHQVRDGVNEKYVLIIIFRDEGPNKFSSHVGKSGQYD